MRADDAALRALAEAVGTALLGAGAMMCCAESCTGGWIAKVCTDVAGSSQWFDRGFVTYSNDAKRQLLGVPAEVLRRHGAVSEACARAMAWGALRHGAARFAVAVTGIAGPTGGTAEKPVGTVWIAWADGATDRLEAVRHHFQGDREAVRRQTVATALTGLLDRLA